MTANEDNIFKSNSGFRNEIKNDIEGNIEKFNDPVVLGEMLYKLLEERENTNRILKNILTKLESLGTQIIEVNGYRDMIVAQSNNMPIVRRFEQSGAIGHNPKEHLPQVLLPEIDEQILSYVKKIGKATAEDVRGKFQYKGTNAASARLNRLCELGLLGKQQVGKKVFFFPLTG